jgi:hypothetical protein
VDLSIRLGQNVSRPLLNRWISKCKLPIPERGPIQKGPVLVLLGKIPHKRGPKTKEHPPGEDDLNARLLQERIRNLEAKNAILEGTRLERDRVSRSILSACASLKSTLTTDLPVRFVEAIRGMPVDAAVEEVRRLQVEAINQFSGEAHEALSLPPSAEALEE